MTEVGDPPALCAVVAGPVQIWVNTGASGALEFLGWSLNGVSIEQIVFQSEVHCDEAGGQPGPPVDYQLYGYQHRISMELAKFQDSVLAKLDPRYNPNTAGGSIAVGMLLKCATATFRVLLKGPNFVRNYLTCVIPNPIELSPIGSQASRARVTFLASTGIGGTLWNTTTTTP